MHADVTERALCPSIFHYIANTTVLLPMLPRRCYHCRCDRAACERYCLVRAASNDRACATDGYLMCVWLCVTVSEHTPPHIIVAVCHSE